MNLSLKQLRKCQDITQRQMAEMLGVHVQTYRKYEANPDIVPVGYAKKISEYLGICYDDIFFAPISTESRTINTA